MNCSSGPHSPSRRSTIAPLQQIHPGRLDAGNCQTTSNLLTANEPGAILSRMADISKHVDKAYEQMSFEQLAEAPVDALQGVSKGDAELLEKAFKIRTIRDLAESKYYRWAQAIVHLAQTSKH